MSDEFNQRFKDFLYSFELVFETDWEYTKDRISDEDFIDKNGNFLNPFPGEHYTGGQGDNWANRSYLLSTYRELKAFAISEGIYNPDDEDWN